MTADYIARLCEKALDQLTTDEHRTDLKHPPIYNYNRACSLLENYLNQNFDTFEETELVYKYAKYICEDRIAFLSWFNQFGWMTGTKQVALNHWKKEYGKYYYRRKDYKRRLF